jgi:hypothetical protein
VHCKPRRLQDPGSRLKGPRSSLTALTTRPSCSSESPSRGSFASAHQKKSCQSVPATRNVGNVYDQVLLLAEVPRQPRLHLHQLGTTATAPDASRAAYRVLLQGSHLGPEARLGNVTTATVTASGSPRGLEPGAAWHRVTSSRYDLVMGLLGAHLGGLQGGRVHHDGSPTGMKTTCGFTLKTERRRGGGGPRRIQVYNVKPATRDMHPGPCNHGTVIALPVASQRYPRALN